MKFAHYIKIKGHKNTLKTKSGAGAGSAAIFGGIMAVGWMMMIMSVIITVVFVKGLLFMENAADLGAFLVHELVVHGSFFPRNFLFPGAEFEDEGFLRLR